MQEQTWEEFEKELAGRMNQSYQSGWKMQEKIEKLTELVTEMEVDITNLQTRQALMMTYLKLLTKEIR